MTTDDTNMAIDIFINGGTIQKEDDVNASAACSTALLIESSGNEKEEAGDKSDDNNNDGSDVDNSKQVKGQGTCGSVKSHSKVWNQQEQPQTVKRRHVQSRRMQEYQQQLTKQPYRNARTCAVCGRTLYSGPGYRYHLQRHRRDNESFPCDNCRKVFKSFNGLKYHQKRKRCRGQAHTVSSRSVHTAASATADSRTLPSCETERLMELAKIATGPQSPLLQSPGPDSQGSVTRAFFDDCDTSAAMTLSSMKQKCSVNEGTSAAIAHKHTDKHEQSEKPKRPMNGFMLFAQRNRTELNKKYPDMNNRMISTKLSEAWKKLPEAERRKWVDEAKEKAKQHQKEHPDCWKRKK